MNKCWRSSYWKVRKYLDFNSILTGLGSLKNIKKALRLDQILNNYFARNLDQFKYNGRKCDSLSISSLKTAIIKIKKETVDGKIPRGLLIEGGKSISQFK